MEGEAGTWAHCPSSLWFSSISGKMVWVTISERCICTLANTHLCSFNVNAQVAYRRPARDRRPRYGSPEGRMLQRHISKCIGTESGHFNTSFVSCFPEFSLFTRTNGRMAGWDTFLFNLMAFTRLFSRRYLRYTSALAVVAGPESDSSVTRVRFGANLVPCIKIRLELRYGKRTKEFCLFDARGDYLRGAD